MQGVIGQVAEEAEEEVLFGCAAEVDAAGLHRALFENGVRLGEGFRRFQQRAVTMAELPAVLSALGCPCLKGQWQTAGPGAWRLVRTPCSASPPRGEGDAVTACDSWREAIDGLVLGLTGGARHTRTASAGHGQKTCVDLVYEDTESPLRYGDLDAELIPSLESVQKFVRNFRGADVRFLGVSEGVLLYQLDTTGCDEHRAPARELIEKLLEQKLPHLQVRELSPRAVLAEGAAHE